MSQTPITSRLISDVGEAVDGIRRFQTELLSNAGLADLLSSFRAWYAVSDENGNILFGPSKFIGYQSHTAKTYLSVNQQIDGRATEAVLSRWFVQPTSASEAGLVDELAKFLGQYGKKPNKLVRVCTMNGRELLPGVVPIELTAHPSRVDAMLVFYEMLSDEEKRELRRRIAR